MSTEVFVAMITTGLGVFGLEVVKRLFDVFAKKQKAETERKKRREESEEDAEKKLRRLMEVQVEELRREVARASEDLNSWRSKYYELVRDHAVLNEKHKALEQDMAELSLRLKAA